MAGGDSRHPARRPNKRQCNVRECSPPQKKAKTKELGATTIRSTRRLSTMATRTTSKSNLQNHSRLRSSHGRSAQDGFFGRSALPVVCRRDDCNCTTATMSNATLILLAARGGSVPSSRYHVLHVFLQHHSQWRMWRLVCEMSVT